MELMPSCRHCGCVLNFVEHYDCYDDGDVSLFFARGYCPECQQSYRWIDVYQLCRIDDLEEEE